MANDSRLITTADIERMVELVNPDWTLREGTPESSGRHFTHRLRIDTEAGEKRVILKTSKDDVSVCHEGRLLAVLNEATDLPVASVHGVVDEHRDLPTPFFIMEELPGESIHKSETDTLSERALRQIAVSSGRQLAILHELDAIDEFGVISVKEGQPLQGGMPAGDPGALYIPDGDTSWAAHLEDSFEEMLDALADSRFSDVRSDVRDAVEPMIAALRADGSFEPAVGRVEHSMDNILVNSGAGEVTGMLDWEFVASMTPANDLVFAEFWLSGGQWGLLPSTPDHRDLIMDGLLEGYRRRGSAAVLEEYRTHRDCYETIQLLRTMVVFEGIFDAYGATNRQRSGAASVLRERLSEVIE